MRRHAERFAHHAFEMGECAPDDRPHRLASSKQMKCSEQTRSRASNILGIAFLLAGFLIAATVCAADPAGPSQIPNIFRPDSTPADSIFRLSQLVLSISAIIFVIVFSLIAYCVVKFRKRAGD